MFCPVHVFPGSAIDIIFEILTKEEIFIERFHSEKEQMNSVQDIERAILRLPKPDLRVLRGWFDELEAEMWDQEFEADVKAGRLDILAQQAIADLSAGRCTAF